MTSSKAIRVSCVKMFQVLLLVLGSFVIFLLLGMVMSNHLLTSKDCVLFVSFVFGV